jgi:hypothetical protein
LRPPLEPSVLVRRELYLSTHHDVMVVM